jgi:hypothetical protein
MGRISNSSKYGSEQIEKLRSIGEAGHVLLTCGSDRTASPWISFDLGDLEDRRTHRPSLPGFNSNDIRSFGLSNGLCFSKTPGKVSYPRALCMAYFNSPHPFDDPVWGGHHRNSDRLLTVAGLVSAFPRCSGGAPSDFDLGLYAHHCFEPCSEWLGSAFCHCLEPETRESLDVCLDQESDGSEPLGLPLFRRALPTVLAVFDLGCGDPQPSMVIFPESF